MDKPHDSLPGRLRAHAWALLGILLCLASHGAAWARQVTLVLSGQDAPYLEAAAVIRRGLEESGARFMVRTLKVEDARSQSFSADSMLIPLGVLATEAVAGLRDGPPVLAAMLPRQSYEKILREMVPVQRQQQFSALYLDQPYRRQLQLLATALPSAERVGVVLGEGMQRAGAELIAAAAETGLQLTIDPLAARTVLFRSLEEVLAKSDVLLLLPDPAVVNRTTLPSLLLTAYRRQLPVIGYSSALVEAGALLAVYSSPAQIGSQIAEMLRRMPPGGVQLPPPQSPRYFTVRVNRNVARSLELAIPADPLLYAALQSEPAP